MRNVALISFFAVVASSQAVELHDFEVGARVATSLNNRTDTFRQVEGTVNYRLPWHWEPGDFHIAMRLDFSAGWLHGEGEDAALGTLGPTVIFKWKDFPVTIDMGSSPTVLSEHHFGGRDFGGDFQFSTHVGVNWEFIPHFKLGYRYSHMSNAGLFTPNPGLNLHMVGISYQF